MDHKPFEFCSVEGPESVKRETWMTGQNVRFLVGPDYSLVESSFCEKLIKRRLLSIESRWLNLIRYLYLWSRNQGEEMAPDRTTPTCAVPTRMLPRVRRSHLLRLARYYFVSIVFPEKVIEYAIAVASKVTAVLCLTSLNYMNHLNFVQSKIQSQWSVKPWWSDKKYDSLWDQHYREISFCSKPIKR